MLKKLYVRAGINAARLFKKKAAMQQVSNEKCCMCSVAAKMYFLVLKMLPRNTFGVHVQNHRIKCRTLVQNAAMLQLFNGKSCIGRVGNKKCIF